MCYIHKGVFGNDAICPKCRACKHTSWFKKENDQVWQCNGCYKTAKDPSGEKHLLVNGKWQEVK